MSRIPRPIVVLFVLLVINACDSGLVGPLSVQRSTQDADSRDVTLQVGHDGTISPVLVRLATQTRQPGKVRFASSDPSVVALVGDSGTIRGMAPGTALVVASVSNLRDTVRVTVVPGLTISPDSAVLDWLGSTVRLQARETLSVQQGSHAAQVTWHSLAPEIASVDSMGIVRAIAAGRALIVATAVGCCGQADTASLRVQQLVTTVAVEPQVVTVGIGGTVQLQTTVRDSGNSVVPDAPTTWTSDNTAIATVSPNGVVRGVAAGTVSVRATAGDRSSSTQVTVTQNQQQQASFQLPLTLHRLDGGSGTVRVSNGILLQPGQLRDGGVGLVTVTVGGTEVPAYVEALHGRHRDGSVVSLLVQFDANPAVQRDAVLHIGRTPQQARLARTTVDFRPGATLSNVKQHGYPAAVAVPPVEHLTAAFQLFGPTVTVSDARAMGGAFSAFEDDFAHWSTLKFDDFQNFLNAGSPRDRIMGSNYYDRGYHHLAWFARTGSPEYLRRGGVYTFNYRFHYYEYHNYNISQERLWLSEGLAAHYWLTGDEESRNAVHKLAQRAYAGGTSWNWTRMNECNYKGEARPVARALSAMTWAHRLGLSDADWEGAVRGYVNLIVESDLWGRDASDYRHGAWIYRHPDFPTGDGCSVAYVSNFMNAMILDALITVHDHVYADSRIPGVVQRNLDYLYRTQWRGVEGNRLQVTNGEPSPSFNYYDVPLAGSGGPNATVDLNGFYVHVFAWYAARSSNPIYRDIADQAFRTLSTNPKDGKSGPWFRLSGADKQFNETYAKAWQYAGYVR
jgi:uncharacterized protein YjdB